MIVSILIWSDNDLFTLRLVFFSNLLIDNNCKGCANVKFSCQNVFVLFFIQSINNEKYNNHVEEINSILNNSKSPQTEKDQTKKYPVL